MPFGQSALIAAMAGGIVKRGAYVAERAQGSSVREADLKSDEIAIAATASAGTMASVVTADPVGLLGTGVAVAGLEREHAMKKEGK